MQELSLDHIRTALSGRTPLLAGEDFRKKASVALILRPGRGGLEVLFIRRAEHPGDPWSGDLGFPGGRIDPQDANASMTAQRETLEELGLDLGRAEYLGQLDDIAGAYLPVRISCFVYCLRGSPALHPNAEVRDFFWHPLAQIADRKNHREFHLHYRGQMRTHPAIDLLGPEAPPLWGITYRLMTGFLQLLGFDLPVETGTPGRPKGGD